MAAKITLTPTSASPGGEITVKGTGFGWRWWVTVRLDGVEVAKAQSSTSGSFTAVFPVPVKPPATYTVTAKTRYRSANAPLAVVAVGPPPVPDPPPPPAPPPTTPRPFPPPSIVRTVHVPDAVDSSAALLSFLTTVPDGTRIEFVAGRDYLMTRGFLMERRNNLDLRGNDARFVMSGADQEYLSPFLLRGSSHIAIEGFRVKGSYAGYPALQGEKSHLLALSGWYNQGPSSYVEMSGVTADHMYGDFVYAEGNNDAAKAPSHHLWVHHNRGDNCGRNAVSPINCNDGLVEDNDWDHINYHVYDIEPNYSNEQVRRWTFRRDKVGSYAHRAGLLGFFARNWNPPGNSPVSDLTWDSITCAGIAANGYDGKPLGINTRFDSPSSNVVFTNNSSPQKTAGPALVFANVAGVRVQGNQQPLSSGQLAVFSNCSGIVTG